VGFKGTWVPIREIIDEVALGGFIKPHSPLRGEGNKICLEKIMGKGFREYFLNSQLDDYEDFPDVTLQEQLCRLGNIEAAYISMCSMAGIWTNVKNHPSMELVAKYVNEFLELNTTTTQIQFIFKNETFETGKKAMHWLISSQKATWWGNNFPSAEQAYENLKLKNKSRKKPSFINTSRDNNFQLQLMSDLDSQGYVSNHPFVFKPSNNQVCDTPTFRNISKNQQAFQNAHKGGINVGRGANVVFKAPSDCTKCDGAGILKYGGITVGRATQEKFSNACPYCDGYGYILNVKTKNV
jgi:hypothetical protein